MNLMNVDGWTDLGGGKFDVQLQYGFTNHTVVGPAVGDPVVHLARYAQIAIHCLKRASVRGGGERAGTLGGGPLFTVAHDGRGWCTLTGFIARGRTLLLDLC